MHVMAPELCCMGLQDAGLLAGGADSTVGSPVGDIMHTPNDGFGVREEVCAADAMLIRARHPQNQETNSFVFQAKYAQL